MSSNIENAYAEYWQLTQGLAGDVPHIALAAIMVAQAMSLYRSLLSPDDYEKMTETIYNTRDQVKTVSFL